MAVRFRLFKDTVLVPSNFKQPNPTPEQNFLKYFKKFYFITCLIQKSLIFTHQLVST